MKLRVILAYGSLVGALGCAFWAFAIWIDTCCFFANGGGKPVALFAIMAGLHVFVRRGEPPVPALRRATLAGVVGCTLVCALIFLFLASLRIA